MSLSRVISGDDWKRGLAMGRARRASQPDRVRAYAAAYRRLKSLPGASSPGVLVEAGSGRGAETCPGRLAGG